MSIKDLLDRSRKEFLDLSTRNRLLSIPVRSKSARIVEVHDELSEQVFKVLVSDKKTFSFLPGRVKSDSSQEIEKEEASLPQPEDDEKDPTTGLARRHTDAKLQTSLTPEGLQRRLLDLYYDSLTMMEEQGVNVLYLVLGHLKWFEADHSDTPRYAPLILVPVELSRKTASERFHMHWREEELQENLSLEAKLKIDFNISLPHFSIEEEFSPSKYFEEVRIAIGAAKGWEVLPDQITLGFFSFAKFLMYRDLDSKNWPKEDILLKQPFITGLLQDGFPSSELPFPPDIHIDTLIPAARLDHVVDADSSQSLAIEAVHKGRSLVIQGPPGTGKSQSITNIISTAVLEGKKVLFVAEKLAALEVVKRRLEREGLGPLCLELHSNKANKRSVIQEIGQTWSLGRPKSTDLEAFATKLEKKRTYLNAHAATIHEPYGQSGMTPFRIIGKLALLGENYRDLAGLTFKGAESWPKETYNESRILVEELIERIKQMGSPSKHPWRGVCKGAVLSIDLGPLEAKIKSTALNLGELRIICDQIAQLISQPIPNNLADIEILKNVADYVSKAPSIDKQALSSSIWKTGLEQFHVILKDGWNFEKAVQDVGEEVNEKIWESDFIEAKAAIAKHGKSIVFCYLFPAYRQALTLINSFLIKKFSGKYDQRLIFLDKVISGQAALRALRGADDAGRAGFGAIWKVEKTNWHQFEAILTWIERKHEVGLDESFHEAFINVPEKEVALLEQQLEGKLSAVRNILSALFEDLRLDLHYAFSVDALENVPLGELAERCAIWLSKMEDLSRWTNYYVRVRRAKELQLTDLVVHMENEKNDVSHAVKAFDRIYFEQLLRAVIKEKPELIEFDGVLHSNHVNEFKELDKERLILAKYRTLIKHHDGMPPMNSGIGATGIVRAEMERKRGHRPVRRLLKDAGSVVQAIKPVFMMSPLSVAQYLEPGAVEFDLLVIDEASQVQPVDAFGAIARCKQIVVVGDSKQLPPTRFFARLTSDSSEEEETEDQIVEAKDIESILGLCCARGLPQTMLRWHYRSRHHSLIAVSNYEFYDNQLFIVPSPYSVTAGLGLKFNFVPNGVFDSGASGTNKIEAKAICKAIIDHARKTPNLTLGVAAFSVRQRQAILDELEFLRREHPDTELFFSGNPTEPFFVKNLENVQGDERDVIFISVGYGRNSSGYMAMRFGPLSSEGGERRLNVLISRARKRCEVFSSITPDDIDLQRASGRGVAAFKAFLSFAKTGRLGIAKETGLEEQSPFEEAVRKAIETLGYEAHPQVGVAGFFIDLAVLDGSGSGRYLLGVECDGASYHSSRSARDRDRLRQAVLEDHGWIIHRVWSIDWFQRPQEQLRKIEEAIERAKRVLAEASYEERPEVTLKIEVDGEEIVRESVFQNEAPIAIPYKEAAFDVPRNSDPHEVSRKEMAKIVLRIVREEGPIHEDEVVVRVKNLWGLGRAGSRIQDAVQAGIRTLLFSKECKTTEGFLSIPRQKVLIRDRENTVSTSLRKPNMLPPDEIRLAILTLIEKNHGSTRTELLTGVGRLFGLNRTGAQIRETIENRLEIMLRSKEIEEDGGMLRRAKDK